MSGPDFQSSFLDHDRIDEEEHRLSADLKCSELENQHYQDLGDAEIRPDSLVHDHSVDSSSFNVSHS